MYITVEGVRKLYLILFFLWIIFCGKVTAEILVLGVILCAAFYWFMCKFMGYDLQREVQAVKRIPSFLLYLCTLVLEIVKSSFAVIKLVLSPKLEIQPAIYTFKTDLKSELTQVMLANSITLTPGTYTIKLDDGTYLLHGLDESYLEGIEDSIFVQRLRKLED